MVAELVATITRSGITAAARREANKWQPRTGQRQMSSCLSTVKKTGAEETFVLTR